MARRSKAELEHEIAKHRLVTSFELKKLSIRVFNNCVLIVGLAFALAHSIGAVAGKDTKVSFLAESFLKLNVSQWGGWLLATVFFGLWRGSRELGRRRIKRWSKRTAELEKRYDPGRSSSQLTEHGDTRPGDE